MNIIRLEVLRKFRGVLNTKKLNIIIIISTMVMLCSVVYAFIYKSFIEIVIMQSNLKNLTYIILAYLLMLSINMTLNWLNVRYKNKLIKKPLNEFKGTILSSYLYKDNATIVKYNTSELITIMENDIDKVNEFIENDIIEYYINLIALSVYFVIMFYLNWRLTLLCIGFYFFANIQTRFLKSRLMKNEAMLRERTVDDSEKRLDELKYYREIKSSSIEDYIVSNYEKRLDKINDLLVKQKVHEYVNYYLGALNHDLIARFFIYIFGGLLFVNGKLTVSAFLVFLGFYQSLIGTSKKINLSNYRLYDNKIKIERVIECVDSINEHEEKENVVDLNLKNEIIFDDVSFRYNEKQNYILNHFNKVFKNGNMYIISGESGVGKSTIVKLLTKEREATSGNIYLNKNTIDTYCMDKYISVSKVGSKIFVGTIMYNLKLANENATMEEIVLACKQADIYEFILEQPNKFDEELIENGLNLSGGQRQRLVMARMFLCNSLIYVIDEGLSEVSSEMESKIIDRFARVKKNAIIFVIAHRTLKLTSDFEMVILE